MRSGRPSAGWRRWTFAALLAAGSLLAGAATFEGKPLPDAGLTAEERAWLQANPDQLTLFYDLNFPPLEFGSETGTFTGMGADICTRVEQILGVSFRRMPSRDWNTHLEKLRSGECAIAPTIAWAADRDEYIFFTKPYLLVPAVIITPQGREDIRALADLAGRRVGVVSGFTTEQYLRDQAQLLDFEVVPVANVPAGLQGAAFGEFDAFVENLAVAAYFIDTMGIPNLRVAGKTDYVFDFRIGVSRRYPLLFRAVRKALEAIPDDERKAIRDEWISLEADPGLDPETRRLLWLAGWFGVLLVAGLAGITFLLKRRLRQRVADLRASEARYRRLVENSPAVVFQFKRTPAGEYSFPYISENSPSVTGVVPQDVLCDAQVFLARIHPDDLVRATAKIEESARTLQAFQGTFRYRQGEEYVWLECRCNPIRLADGSVQWDGLFLNVTERKQAAKILRQRESYLNAIIENQPGLVWLKDADGRFLAVNTAFARACGRESPDQVQGKTDLDVWPRELAEKYMADDLRVVQQGKGGVEEEPIFAGGQTRWFETFKQPVWDREGRILGTAGYALDTTERKRAQEEKERLESQLAQAQKMDSIGQLAGGVAHDFNNMLGVILGNTELALESTPPDMPLHAELVEIRKAAERSAALTRQLLAFARKQTVLPRVLAINDTIEGMLSMLRRLIGEEIEVDWRPGPDAGQVRMDPTQIDQLLVNLCVNARDAIGGLGRIRIVTGSAVFAEADCAAFAGAVPGTYTWMAVEDNGRGMEPDTLQHIFEPFFTTKGVGKGTGLGLATVYGIIKQNDGFIGVDSTPGKGTTFTLYLPRHDAAAPLPPPPAGGATGGPARRTVLLVEDEPAILHMVRALLEHQGFAVLATESPGEAIRLVRERAGAIDLLLSDVVMPELNGRDLARRLLEIRPDLRCLFMSGHAANILVREGALASGVHFLHKPFSAAALLGKIREALGEA